MHDLLIDEDEVRRLRETEMLNSKEVAKRLGVGETMVLRTIKRLGLPSLHNKKKQRNVPLEDFRPVWCNQALTVSEVGRAFGITAERARRIARQYGLGKRDRVVRSEEIDVPTAADIAASEDSLALAPGVQRRIAELGLGIPQAEAPDVKPWFAVTTEPGPYEDDPEDGYAYDE